MNRGPDDLQSPALPLSYAPIHNSILPQELAAIEGAMETLILFALAMAACSCSEVVRVASIWCSCSSQLHALPISIEDWKLVDEILKVVEG